MAGLMKPSMLDLSPEALAEAICAIGQPPYRGRQIYGWLVRGVGFGDMTSLPADLRERLSREWRTGFAAVAERRDSLKDGTRKYLFEFDDGERVEGVRMTYRHGVTLCISTQVGCPMGCVFCASGLGGRVRNLTSGEMLAQVIAANLDGGEERVNRVVMMGSGEPLDNYMNTVGFLRLVNRPDGLNMGLRNISLSTCGLPGPMRRLAAEGLPVTLSVSLHAPSEEIRKRLMPVAGRYPIRETVDAARYYVEKTGRRVIFEYVLIRGVNDRPEHARQLADLIRGMQCHVNLISLNTVPESGLEGSGRERAEGFRKELAGCGVSVTRRREMGNDIEGACGQLRLRRGKGGTV